MCICFWSTEATGIWQPFFHMEPEKHSTINKTDPKMEGTHSENNFCLTVLECFSGEVTLPTGYMSVSKAYDWKATHLHPQNKHQNRPIHLVHHIEPKK